MKYYQTPGGKWSTSEQAWKDDMQSEGLDPKTYKGRSVVDVPTKKAELIEWLTFHNVNIVNPPQPGAPAGEVVRAEPTTIPDLDEQFAAAPIGQQLRLAVAAADAADQLIRNLSS